jgi:shikimate dehydrogenase
MPSWASLPASRNKDITMVINGNTELIAHIGYPTHAFKAPMIYNPWFQQCGVNAVVVPMGSKPEDFPGFLRALFKLSNIRGALITMPHKIVTVGLLDEVSPTASIAGACNAVRLSREGRLQGDMFDGEGFVRGLLRKGCVLRGARVMVVGCGGVGSAIAASLAAAGVAGIALFDAFVASQNGLAERLQTHYPALQLNTGSNDPAGFDVVVNATPMGMNTGDPMPIDVDRIAPTTFVGEVVMKSEMTAFLEAVRARGCRYQIGSDMLFEQIPAYLEFFGLPSTTPDALRAVATLQY